LILAGALALMPLSVMARADDPPLLTLPSADSTHPAQFQLIALGDVLTSAGFSR
jgi:hypothetical protein